MRIEGCMKEIYGNVWAILRDRGYYIDNHAVYGAYRCSLWSLLPAPSIVEDTSHNPKS